MKWLIFVAPGLKLLFNFILALLLMCWDAVLLIVDVIDGDDSRNNSNDYNHSNKAWPNYEHRLGEIDPSQYPDGICDRDLDDTPNS